MAPVCRLVAAAAAAAFTTTGTTPTTTTGVSTAAPTSAGISRATLSLVKANALQVSTESWELGTLTEALLEYEWPSLSVFNESALPPPLVLSRSQNASDVLDIASSVVAAKASDTLTLMADSAVGDPASLGVSVLLANWTRTNPTDYAYSTAAGEELDYLLNHAPRTDAGAISHRSDEVQLWADFIYMAPPFLAYYGALAGGDEELSLIQAAYDQISLYRDVLRDDSGLWQHVLLGTWSDTAHWATGNAWAAAGMLRVLATMNHTDQASHFTEHSANLTNWINEIIETSWKFQTTNGTLLNVIDDDSSFADSSATALIAAVTYRMAVFTNDTSLIPYADKALKLIKDSIDDNGWLQNTVDPYTFTTATAAGGYSPEGQSFVVLLAAAYRDWIRFSTA